MGFTISKTEQDIIIPKQFVIRKIVIVLKSKKTFTT